MSRSVSAPSLVTNTSPCWKGFIVPGSTFRYGSSFCMVTRRPRALSRAPRLEAVRPLPREEATPPVTKMCLVVVDVGCIAKGGSRGRDREVRTGVPVRRIRRCRRCGSGASSAVADDHRSTGYQGNSDEGSLLPATPGTLTTQDHRMSLTPHPFGSVLLSRASRGSPRCVVSCSDTRSGRGTSSQVPPHQPLATTS